MNVPQSFHALCRESSGTSICDSGSAYGYQWQRPAIPTNMPLEYARPHVWTGRDGKREVDAGLAISLAALLEEHFEIDRRATIHFRRWCEMANPLSEAWPSEERSLFSLAREYVSRMREKGRCGEYADGLDSINTYNSETDLDQVVEITTPGLNAGWHVIHVHTGCDVRGGYTAPVVANGDLEGFICGWRIELECPHCGLQADDMYHAEEQGWRPRVYKRMVALLCPKCRRAACRFPIVEEVTR